MFVGAAGAPGESVIWQVRQDTRTQDPSGAFSAEVQRLVGDYPNASERTLATIRALEGRMGLPQPTWRNGVYAITNDTMTAERDATLDGFVGAVGSLLDDYGIDRTAPISLGQDFSGRIRVLSDHPEAAAIENLLNGSFLLQNAMRKIMALSQQVWMNQQMAAGLGDPAQAATALRDMAVDLGGNGDSLAGIVHLFDQMLTRAVQHKADKQAEYAAKQFEAYERQLEEQLRKERILQDRIKAEKLAQEAADKRYEQIHPEQKPRPVFL